VTEINQHHWAWGQRWSAVARGLNCCRASRPVSSASRPLFPRSTNKCLMIRETARSVAHGTVNLGGAFSRGFGTLVGHRPALEGFWRSEGSLQESGKNPSVMRQGPREPGNRRCRPPALGSTSCRGRCELFSTKWIALKLWVRGKRGNRKLVCSGCGRKLADAYDSYEREVRDLPCFEGTCQESCVRG